VCHADGNPTVIGRPGKPGESECCSQESAALGEHGLFDHTVRLSNSNDGIDPQGFGSRKVDDEFEPCGASSTGKSAGFVPRFYRRSTPGGARHGEGLVRTI
jgi:hypothetical protein